jgi:hypothetical protein
MSRLVPVAALLVALFVGPGLSEANRPGPVKNQKNSDYARQRARGPSGRFLPVTQKDKATRAPLLGRGRANPSMTGQSTAEVKLTPATASRGGSLTVDIPEMYVGSQGKGGATRRQLFTSDIRGKQVVIDGVLDVKPSRTGFAKATFRGTIPRGTTLSQRNVSSALRSLQVSEISLSWTDGAAAR